MTRSTLALTLALGLQFMSAEASALELRPKPKFISIGRELGSDGPVKVFAFKDADQDGDAKALAKATQAQFKVKKPEAYALATLAAGAVILADSPAAENLARQTLAQIKIEKGKRPQLTLADYPRQAMRGLHVLDSGSQGLPAIKRLIQSLAAVKANVLIYEIDYNFAFKKHPELGGAEAGHPELKDANIWTRDQVRELVAEARKYGITVIPEINCFGHQSWKLPPNALLRAHPDFEEPSDDLTPQRDVNSPNFYCRSWCPLHPEVHQVVFELIDELLEAFEAKAFHVGMDEVFLIASKNCPRCKGKNPADLYAGEVLKFHKHLKSRGAEMLIWGDRFLDGNETKYGSWEASTDGVAPAIKHLPKDVIVCDWHYEGGNYGQFPSLDIFMDRGNRVWPTVFKDEEAGEVFMKEANLRNNALMLGTLTSIWYPAERMQLVLEGKTPKDIPANTPDPAYWAQKQREIAQSALNLLVKAWEGVE